MTKLLTIFAYMLCSLNLQAQYWQQQVDHSIRVELEEDKGMLRGYQEMRYQNNSPDTLNWIWIHLWPNAYSSQESALNKQMLDQGNSRLHFAKPEDRGWIRELDFRVGTKTVMVEPHPQYNDVIKLVLNDPLLPDQDVLITTPFTGKLPYYFSRSGIKNGVYAITQWFPKPAVYDQNGWHEMPYIEQGEFYSEFGTFEVEITTAESIIVAATGRLTESKIQGDKRTEKYFLNRAHDFAWFASRRFEEVEDSVIIDDRVIQLSSYGFTETFVTNGIEYLKNALRFYSSAIGPYPFDEMKIVEGPVSFAGGMEYPGLTVISTGFDNKTLDRVIAHETGHNWFQGALASNERKYPWMDEGLNSYYERRYMEKFYKTSSSLEELLYQTTVKAKQDQPIHLPSDEYDPFNYPLITYHKTAEWFKTIENRIGRDSFASLIRAYYAQWQFRHPQPGDLIKIISTHSSLDADTLWRELNATGNIYQQNRLSDHRIISPVVPSSIREYFEKPTARTTLISPLAGINSIDGLMPGLVLTNYSLPPQQLKYLFIPLIGLSSGKVNWISRIAFDQNLHPGKRISLHLNSSSFSIYEAQGKGKSEFLRMKKLVPGIAYESTRDKQKLSVEFKQFFISEEKIPAFADTLLQGSDTVVRSERLAFGSRQISRINFRIENSRTLNPYSVNLGVDKIGSALRPTLTTNYKVSYRGGGLNMRFFGGGLISSGRNQINRRYQLSLNGIDGFEDYTYSHYFFGRNENADWESRQMVIRDGSLKLQLPAKEKDILKSDSWMTSFGFEASIPFSFAPFRYKRSPLSVFVDIGSSGKSWESTSGKILFNAGLALTLLDESVRIFLPLLYSQSILEAYRRNDPRHHIFKTVSFSFNIFPPSLQKLKQDLNF